MATITNLNFHILARYSGDGAFRRARNDIQQTERAAGGANSNLSRTGRLFVTVARAALIASPAMRIFNQAIIASAGALVSLGAMIAVTGGLFAGLAITAAKNAKTMGAWGARFTQSVNGVKAAWMSLARSTASQTLRPMVTVLNATRSAIGQLRPLIVATAPAFQDLANKIAHFLTSGQGLGRFLNTMKTFGVPALHAMLNAGFSLFQVLIRGVEAFAPLGLLLARLIERGAAALAKWANHGGFDRFVASVRGNGPILRNFFQALGPAIVNVARAFGILWQLARPLSPLFLIIATAAARLIAAMPPQLVLALALAWIVFGTAIKEAAIQLLLMMIRAIVYNGTMIAIRVGMLLWTAAQWALNAAMWANPIGVLIGLIALLIAAVAAIAFGIFELVKHWNTVWHAITSAASTSYHWMAANVFGPMVHWFTTFIPAAARTVWHGVTAAWHAIGTGVSAAYHFLAGNVFGPVVHWFATFIPAAARTVWHGVVAAWNAIGRGIRAAYNFLARNVFGPIVHWFVTFIPGAARTVWHAVVAAWNAIGKGLRSAYNFLARNVFSPMVHWFTSALPSAAKTVWHALVFAFTKAKEGVIAVWNKLRAGLKAPIAFFVNTVYNHGLVPMWNNTIGKIPGVPNLPKARGFARGGHVQGPGGPRSDMIPAMLSDGEYVINAKAARAIGYDKLARLNSLAKGGKPKPKGGGGILDTIGGAIGGAIHAVTSGAASLGGLIKKGFDWAVDFTTDIADKILNVAFKPFDAALHGIKSRFGGHPPNSFAGGPANILFGAGENAIKVLKAFIKGKAMDFGSFGGGHIPAGQHKAVIMAALKAAHVPPPGSLSDWLIGMNTLIQRESGWNAGAVNRTDSNARAGHASRGLAQTIPSTFNAYVPAALRHLGINNPVANVAAAIRYIVARYGNITRVQQANPHRPPKGYALGGMVRSYDSGGYLPEGLSLAYNGTGAPEPVGLGGDVHFHGSVYVKSEREFREMVIEAFAEAKRRKRV